MSHWKSIASGLPRVMMLLSAAALAGCGGDHTGKSTAGRKEASNAAAGTGANAENVPKAVAPETLHDFGTIELGEAKVHEFSIRNEGTGTLELKSAGRDCKCTDFEIAKAALDPNESTEVKVTFRIDKPMASEMFEQSVRVGTNDPENSEIRLRVKGVLTELFDIRPSRIWEIGDFRSKDSPKAEGTIVSSILDEFEISELVSHTPDNLKIASTPLDKAELAELGVKSGYKLVATIEGETALGPYESYFDVRTPARGGVELPIIVRWKRVGPLKIYGLGANWKEELNLLTLDKFPAAQGKSAKLALFVEEGDEPLKMEALEVKPEWLEVKLEQDKLPKGKGQTQKYLLTVTVPPGKPTEVRNSVETAATVKIKTNQPDIGMIEIKVVYVAL